MPGTGLSVPLSDIQRHVIDVFASVEGNETFAVAGGSGLVCSGAYDRETRDIDLFTSTGDLPTIVERFIAALETEGFKVTPRRRSETFTDLVVSRDGAGTIVDLAKDFQLLAAQRVGKVMVLDQRELAANKVLALWGRREARDLDDVIHLSKEMGLANMCAWAKEKDLGFSTEHLARHLRLPIFAKFDARGTATLVAELETLVGRELPPPNLDAPPPK